MSRLIEPRWEPIIRIAKLFDMKAWTMRMLTTPWLYFGLVGIILMLSPAIYLYVHRMDNRVWTTVHVRYEGQLETISSIPYAMDYNGSRIVQFVVKPAKGVLALNRLEQGKVTLKGALSAPGFEVQGTDPAEQTIGSQNVWNFVVMPKRAGDQVLMFRVQFTLSDDASPAQTKLFRLWGNKIAEADARQQDNVASYAERTTVHVVESWLRLETLVQVVGLASTLAALIMSFMKKSETAPAE
jgi:hypothetical protein